MFFRNILISFFLFISSYDCFDFFSKGSVILDDEIEMILGRFASDLSSAAKIKGSPKLKINIIVDESINAFATVGRQIYVNTALILSCDSYEEFLGVISHETAHISGGHVVRMMGAYEKNSAISVAGTLLGGLVAIATGNASLLVAGAMTSSHISERSFLKSMRSVETEADDNAHKYLAIMGVSANGLHKFLGKLREANSITSQEKYTRSHPLSKDRMSRLKSMINRDKNQYKKNFEYESLFNILKAKISGILIDPKAVIKKYDSQTIPDLMAKSIAYSRMGNIKKAIENIDKAISIKKSAFLYEIKAQILFESSGRLGASKSSIKDSKNLMNKSYEMSGKKTWISVAYAHMLSEIGDDNDYKKAISILNSHDYRTRDYPFVWRIKAKLYGKLGNVSKSRLMIVEEAIASGDMVRARKISQGLLSSLKSRLNNSSKSEKMEVVSLINKVKDILNSI